MTTAIPALLSTHPNIRTEDVTEARSAVARYLTPHDFLEVSDDFRLVHNVINIGSVTLHYIDYGGAVTIHPIERTVEYYLVQVPLSGRMLLRSGRHLLEIHEGQALGAYLGSGESRMEYGPLCPRLLVQIPLTVMRKAVARMTPTVMYAVNTSINHFDVSQGAGHSWIKLLLWILTDVDNPSGMSVSQQGATYLESLIVDGLLLAQSDSIEPVSSHSRIVGAAIDYMRANLNEPLSPSLIASKVHISVRALQEGFRRDLETTPMTYLRDLRLEAVHRDLQSSEPGGLSVAEIAHSHGVNHLGRFAQQYRERFGILPSETLRVSG